MQHIDSLHHWYLVASQARTGFPFPWTAMTGWIQRLVIQYQHKLNQYYNLQWETRRLSNVSTIQMMNSQITCNRLIGEKQPTVLNLLLMDDTRKPSDSNPCHIYSFHPGKLAFSYRVRISSMERSNISYTTDTEKKMHSPFTYIWQFNGQMCW